ncbi:hypothetical protein HGA91_01270 [candidate division WWE3 bacterium]|nr:hypothetical protein [candidate division WWE3 bacterium]
MLNSNLKLGKFRLNYLGLSIGVFIGSLSVFILSFYFHQPVSVSAQACPAEPDYAAMGLPQPEATGSTGYLAFRAKIQSDANTQWDVNQMLSGEAYAASHGFTIIRYLNTAWLWFENGYPFSNTTSGRPDPYLVNCNDNRSLSQVSVFCSYRNYQIGGYQAGENRKHWKDVFISFYGSSVATLRSKMNEIVNNSPRAQRDAWNYLNSGQAGGLGTYRSQINTATFDDIANTGGEAISRTGADPDRRQYFTMIIGKDPAIASAFNSQAVSTGDLVRALKTQDCAYGYICQRHKQVLANIVAALYAHNSCPNYTPSASGSPTPIGAGPTDVPYRVPTIILPTIREGWVHPGIDVKPNNSLANTMHVYSTHAGFVTYAGPAPQYIREKGWMIQIESDLNRDNVPDMITRYTHLMPYTLMLNDVHYRRTYYGPDYFVSLSNLVSGSSSSTERMTKLPYGYGPYVARGQQLGLMGDSGTPGRRHIQYEIITNRYLSTLGIGLDDFDCRDNPFIEVCRGEDYFTNALPGYFFSLNRKRNDEVRGPVYVNAGFITPPPTPTMTPIPGAPTSTPRPTAVPTGD